MATAVAVAVAVAMATSHRAPIDEGTPVQTLLACSFATLGH